MQRVSRRSVLLGVLGGAGLVVARPVLGATPAAAAAADPFGPTAYAGRVPSPAALFGADFGARDLTADEILRYVDAVGAASDRVVTGRLSRRTREGREMAYAVVGRPEHVEAAGLARIAADAQSLRRGRTPAGLAAAISRRSPAITWIIGNAHGDEKSGADAALWVLRDLADRTDAAAAAILDATVLVVVPTVNPDGRETVNTVDPEAPQPGIRRNALRFDLNREWVTRTQPEIDALVELVRELPPVLFVDAHEMTQRDTFWIPPYGDPTYHEIHEQAVTAIAERYAPAVVDAFERFGIPYLQEEPYDAFYVGKGSTTSTTGFLAAGVLTEKEKLQPASVRVPEQYTALWALVSAAADAKADAQREVHAAHVEALRQGEAGELEPNRTYVDGNTVAEEVPDRTVRHYFLRDDPDRVHELHQLLRRLQRMDVEVYRLRRPLHLPDYRPYGREPRAETLPAGTYLVPMAQSQKHFVQAALNESTYPSVPVFYDVAAWSQPLLLNLDGGSSGAELRGNARRYGTLVGPLGDTPPLPAPSTVPRTAIWLDGRLNYIEQSVGWLQHTWEAHWGLPRDGYTVVSATDIRDGVLADHDALVLPEGASGSGPRQLDRADPDDADTEDGRGTAEIRALVERGGTLVAWEQAARLVVNIGIGTSDYDQPDRDIPGSLLRLRVDSSSPLAAGVGPFVWALNDNDAVLIPGDGVAAPVRYPELDSEDFFVSGYARELEDVAGTAAVTDERVGDGRVVLFAMDPCFRAAAEGTSRLVWNALFGPRPEGAAPAGLAAASAATTRQTDDEIEPLVIVVDERDAAATERLVRGYADPAGLAVRTRRSGGRLRLVVENPGEWDVEQHPFAGRLASDLRRARVRLQSLRLP